MALGAPPTGLVLRRHVAGFYYAVDRAVAIRRSSAAELRGGFTRGEAVVSGSVFSAWGFEIDLAFIRLLPPSEEGRNVVGSTDIQWRSPKADSLIKNPGRRPSALRSAADAEAHHELGFGLPPTCPRHFWRWGN